ncbi:MAG: fructosamine kinase family protein [Balneolia bacterium]|nr:fructosamine kinase family protein [Balneolia bacterium]
MIPDSIKRDVEAAEGITLRNEYPLSGGSINDAAVADSGSERVVIKWNTAARASMFETEHQGLDLLRKHTDTLLVPEVYSTGKNASYSWIVMEYIHEGSNGSTTDREFGNGLAALHRNTASGYGLSHNNYIGRLPQNNSPHEDWVTFFMIRRIEPQIRAAVDSGLMPSSCIKKLPLLQRSAASLFPDEPASLLHGDLWSGNYLYSESGQAALIDPAVYYGNREIELAFTMLFGRFPAGFYEAYEEAWPIEPGFAQRRDLYNLYPVLVHVNLFGGGYVSQANAIFNQYT